ncbi:MAG TPA: O-antigen ligase family protein [Rudaea sp.]|nr:O-antigen ligase family protein [Rudaea sp.]
MSTASPSRMSESGSALLVLAVLALLPVGRSAELPLWIGAVAGIVLVWRDRATLSKYAGAKLAIVLFACYWLPALTSAPGSIAPDKTWSTVAVLLRFLPFALFVCIGLRRTIIWPRIVAASAAITVLWLLDAWVQIFTGYSIAGAMSDERLSGIFGAGNLKLGPVLAVLSPFVFVAARERFGWRGLALAFVFQLMPILLAGSRAAWLMFGLVTLAFAWRETKSLGRFVALAASAAGIVVISAAVAWHASSAFDARVQRSLLALQGSQHAVDEASAGRLRIWSTAARMFEAHPFNGVGVRGFRYAYPNFAESGDAFIDTVSDEGASHAHQIVLEIASETGVSGLILWIIGAALALRAWLRAHAAARTRAFAPALALAVMCFPLNTHLAFYSAWWGLLFWWLLSLYCAALNAEPADGA